MQANLEQELLGLRELEKKLRQDNEIKQKRIEALERNVEALTQALMQAAKQRFGSSSEKTPLGNGQLYLFGEDAVISLEEEKIEKQTIRAHSRLKRKSGDKERLIADIPLEIVECVLNEDDNCDVCSSPLQFIGKKTVRTELEYIPARLKASQYMRYIYKCSTCGTTDAYPDAVIKKAPVPAPVMPRSLASPTTVSWIMYQKYAMAVPLYRQEKEWLRMGLALTRSNMSNWVIQCTSSWLKPIYNRMHEKLLTYDIIMSDETTMQCNKEKGRKASSTSYLWLHRNGESTGPPVILFEYTQTRSGENAKQFLNGFSGYLVSDAYAGYEKVENITRCLCWAHLRRYYLEAIPLDGSKKEIPGSAGAIGRAYCDKLFKLERQWKYLSPKERKQKRLEQSIPVLNAFFAWAEKVYTNQEPLKKAIKYTLNHKEYFTNFLLDGRIPLSNNLSENSIRSVAIARKNYLFSDTPQGAEANALVFSIIETAVANGLDPYEYLVYIFKNLPNLDFYNRLEILDDYLPWSDKLPDICREKKTRKGPEEGKQTGCA